jgi:hypothetical protein
MKQTRDIVISFDLVLLGIIILDNVIAVFVIKNLILVDINKHTTRSQELKGNYL